MIHRPDAGEVLKTTGLAYHAPLDPGRALWRPP